MRTERKQGGRLPLFSKRLMSVFVEHYVCVAVKMLREDTFARQQRALDSCTKKGHELSRNFYRPQQ